MPPGGSSRNRDKIPFNPEALWKEPGRWSLPELLVFVRSPFGFRFQREIELHFLQWFRRGSNAAWVGGLICGPLPIISQN